MTAPAIVCVGWGSLIWKPSHAPDGPLAAQGVRPGLVAQGGSWRADGPRLPLELARSSAENVAQRYPSWVITAGAAESVALWAPLELPERIGGDLDRALVAAAEALGKREGAAPSRIGRWPGGAEARVEDAAIAAWASAQRVDGVVWTALPPKWGGDARAPSAAEVLALLRELIARGDHAVAEEYIRRSPAQVTSPIRTAIERELGWTAV